VHCEYSVQPFGATGGQAEAGLEPRQVIPQVGAHKLLAVWDDNTKDPSWAEYAKKFAEHWQSVFDVNMFENVLGKYKAATPVTEWQRLP
jgi:hypothetical protein